MDVHNPNAAGAARCPMHDEAFAAAPEKVYDYLRAHGPAGPVELAPGVDATLVVEHETARRVLQNPGVFARDGRRWTMLAEGRIPLDSPVLPMMAYRPNCLFTDGAQHLRLRKAVTESLDKLNVTRIRRDVEPIAAYLIDQFSELGRADVINHYAKLLPMLLINKLFGCPAAIGDRVTTAMADMFDGRDAQRASEELSDCFLELVSLKRRSPAEDITSWLVQHPAGLSDEELKDQLVMLIGASVEPERNLIGNSLLLLLERGGDDGPSMQIEDALDHVLLNNPPIANYATHFPLQDVDLGGVLARANTPVVISFAGANSDPSLTEAGQAHSRSAHLAWGAGPHACPAKSLAQVIAVTAIEQLLNALPDITLSGSTAELQWRPGPFHRALVALPVEFSPTPATRTASAYRTTPARAAAQPTPLAPVPAPTATAGSAGGAGKGKKGFWSSFLEIFRV
ncbi:cytochrome P450 [Streptomyces sp. DSM 44915]|uniref:Cytochrome P450 n=1 Tax=Streptomyces chisholmiae TaxID=3075540 RepID=A0ABU2JYL7_9ACTN|nr:cytochrome P450 [Streptomyces sp. DSM 44915]MDT0270059.1 cytochrome P450 [Streptomyces sp. DSM 44915]